MKRILFLLFCMIPFFGVFAEFPIADDVDVYGQLCFKNSAGDTLYCLPASDGTSGQVLKTDGDGNLIFGDASDLGLKIDPTELNAVNSPSSGTLPSFDETTGQFTWVSPSDCSTVDWGNITGTLSSQSDLQSALDDKVNTADTATWDKNAADDFSGDYNDLTNKPTNFADDDVTDDNVESMTTTGSVGSAPISDGAGNLTMLDVLLQTEIDSEAKLEAYLGVNLYSENDDVSIGTESIEDTVAGLINDEDSSHHLITFTYNDYLNAISATIEDDLSLYDNSTSGFLTSEVDGSTTNELQNLFSTFSVSGQNNIVADSQTDTLTFIAGRNISLLTDSVNKTIEIISADIPPDDWEDITNKPVTAYGQAFDNSDLTAGQITITHGLNEQYCVVALYDNNGNTVTPDEITAVDVNTLTVDLSSWGAITGTWYARVVIAGGDVNFGTYVLTVSELDGSPSVANVDGIKFNQDSGFILTDNGDNTVTVSLGSHFKTIQVAGQNDIVASGEDTLVIEAGANTAITTDEATNTLTITATSGADGDEKTKVSSNDTTAGYLNGKIIAGTNITISEGNDGGNEILTISADGGALGDSIDEDNSSVEVVDIGDGYITFIEDGTEQARITNGAFRVKREGGIRGYLDYTPIDSYAVQLGSSVNDWSAGIDIPSMRERDFPASWPYTIEFWYYPTQRISGNHGNVFAPSRYGNLGDNGWGGTGSPQVCMMHNVRPWFLWHNWKSFETYSHKYTVTTECIPGQWNHVMAVWIDFNTAYFYVNGEPSTYTKDGGNPGSTAVPYFDWDEFEGVFGGGSLAPAGSVGNKPLYGAIDEFRIFHSDRRSYLTDSYQGGVGQTGSADEPGLIMGWHFDETGSTAYAYKSSRHGTLVGNAFRVAGATGTSPHEVDIITTANASSPGVLGDVTFTSQSTDSTKYGNVNIDGREIDLKISGTSKIRITSDGKVILADLSQGIDQASAGASAGELWVDTDDGYVLKLGQ